ncbi:glycogen/starch/alpha-glucan phosphorylase [Leucothrix sargassi]|nr:glycogen/starch/alpha-glucan phosphorylase [Leucothrix sargassi]
MSNENNSEIPQPLAPLPVTSDALEASLNHYLTYYLGHNNVALPEYAYSALSLALRDRIMASWTNTQLAQRQKGVRQAHYLSFEFLIGRALGNHILNMDIKAETEEALKSISIDLAAVEATEPDAGLGRGGTGRLAASVLDSCTTQQLPMTGYGIRYQYGAFRQAINNGYQEEKTDHWLKDGNPWEIERPEDAVRIKFGGYTDYELNDEGRMVVEWVDTQDILAVPYDMPVSGYQSKTINTLRLWQATPVEHFDVNAFNSGADDHVKAAKQDAEKISMVLYPSESVEGGRELRLKQHYFLASATVQDTLRQWEKRFDGDIDYMLFADDNVFQINGTQPTLAIPELMRVLVDERGLTWDEAWHITSQCFAYTHRTDGTKELEKWSVAIFEMVVPRILEIIYEINSRYLKIVSQCWPTDMERIIRMSIIEEESAVNFVRISHLAIAGSFAVSGASHKHSEFIKHELFPEFYDLWPEKFTHKTTGITPRRWLAHANPLLAKLISEHIGDDWIRDLTKIKQLTGFADAARHAEFHQQWQSIKQTNKQTLAALVKERTGVSFNTDALFDVQVGPIHACRRQVLNVLHAIHLYLQIKKGKTDDLCPRCILITGKAAPDDTLAKDVIKLINNVADVINNDEAIGDALKLVFLPDYNISLMETIVAGADLSEQLSVPSQAAPSTSGMKLMLNGALTIGTHEAGNLEIRDTVSSENIFLFSLSDEELSEQKAHYRPYECVDHDEDLNAVIELLQAGHFNQNEPDIFDNLMAHLLSFNDTSMALLDFRGLVDTQALVAKTWKDQALWTSKSILNTAHSGYFSIDRTVTAYNKDIWKLDPITTL